ncbi:transferase family-domain-containing protein [Lasiosphaeris hirsuta]|uniref:Transferase family-domain-containing protein n=1 Tax=Lasiosphaeris hirsuta TaxID=260670 RepID=A0AA40E2C9_9PEZI|nr:transferase family-domain-containing protein [Lasiosphaeris hirsuta]
MTSLSTTPGDQKTVYLSAFDQNQARVYVRVFLVFESDDPIAAVNNLKAGLKGLTSQLPYLKGSISAPKQPAARGRLAITWSPSTDKDLPLPSMPASVGRSTPSGGFVVPSFKQLKDEHAPNHYFHDDFDEILALRAAELGEPKSGSPVFLACYSVIEGGVVLGLGAHHSVLDGTGQDELVRIWAQCTRGEAPDVTTAPLGDEPLHRDEMFASAVAGAAGPRELDVHELLERHPEFTLKNKERGGLKLGPDMPLGRAHVFGFDGSKLEEARAALRASHGGSVELWWLTLNNIICAILWKCITRARAARREGGLGAPTSKMGLAVNGRSRLGGVFTERPFLGNVNMAGTAELPASVLGSTGSTPMDLSHLLPAIENIAVAIKRVTPTHIGEMFSLYNQVPDVSAVWSTLDTVHGPDLSVTSWANMGLYGYDFGPALKKPEFMRGADFSYDGLLCILPRKRLPPNQVGEQGAVERIEVTTMLNVEDIAALLKDPVWTHWLL